MKIEIRLIGFEEVKSFSKLIATYKGEATLSDKITIVEANSILGIFSLNLMKPLILELKGSQEENEKLIPKLKSFILDCSFC